MDFITLDFETATSQRDSPCEIGLTGIVLFVKKIFACGGSINRRLLYKKVSGTL